MSITWEVIFCEECSRAFDAEVKRGPKITSRRRICDDCKHERRLATLRAAYQRRKQHALT